MPSSPGPDHDRPLEVESTQTDWSMVMRAAGDGDARAAALETLLRRYWPAVYAFIRASGRDVHEAADLTQGFVCDVVIRRRLLEAADPRRGRFRSLLLRAVTNYLRDQHRHESAARRTPAGSRPLALDPSELASIDDGSARRPEDAFATQWSVAMVRQVLARVREGCLADGLEAHWTVFEMRVARPLLFGEPPASYAWLVRQLDLADSSQAANMMVTVKRRFAKTLYEEVSRTVDDPMQTEGELLALLRDLERPS
ncbi:MAG: RNA polymerase sigma factor [Planctomycetota bacterium]